jgi:DNA mismatch repair protein MutL
MGRIHLLEDELIDKIAAGEVVERPASVVKELVENAIDAGSQKIRVDLEDGGKKLISITDNGQGIEAEDALLAIKRHATSKISNINDLFNVVTMGFRGEALASIASVSRFTLFSRTLQAENGIKVLRKDDDYISLPWNGPTGTTVQVADLFYNVPVRQGFLKKGASEFSACFDYLEALALSLPEIGFTLFHNGKLQFETHQIDISDGGGVFKGENALRRRTEALLNSKETRNLIYVRESGKFATLEALVSPPGVEKGSAGNIYTFVNGRWVKDKVIRYGILRGYQSHLLKGKFPIVVMHLNIDPSLVDVNVHPSKTEIRLQYANEVQTLIAHAIRNALRQGAWSALSGSGFFNRFQAESLDAKDDGERETKNSPEHLNEGQAAVKELQPGAGDNEIVQDEKRTAAAPDAAPPVSVPLVAKRTERSVSPGGGVTQERKEAPLAVAFKRPVFASSSFMGRSSSERTAGSSSFIRPEAVPQAAQPVAAARDRQSDKVALSSEPVVAWQDLEYIGSFAKCYLLFSFHDRMLVIDQHAFHERILYEKLLKDDEQLCRSQKLLMPEAIELSFEQKSRLFENSAYLSQIGFELGDVENSSFVEVNAVPMLLTGKDIEAVVLALADPIKGSHEDRIIAEPTHEVLARIACHSAVRAGEQLDESHVRQLIAEAREVDFFHNCPHGRRVFRVFKTSEVAAWFDR